MQVGVLDAKNRFSELLSDVEQGGEVAITRHGRPIARIVPASFVTHDREAAQKAIEALIRDGTGARLDGLPLAELLAEGRR